MSAVAQLKHPPSSMEAEANVLGALLVDNRVLAEIGDVLTAGDFYRADHQALFAEIGAMVNAGLRCDFVTLSERLRGAGQLDAAGGMAYLADLALNTHTAANVTAHAKIIRDHSDRRRVIAAASQVMEAAYGRETPDELKARLSQALTQLETGNGQKVESWAEALEAAAKRMKAAQERRKAGGMVGVPFGLPALDHMTGGLPDGALVVLAARPGTGKSALLKQIGVNAARRGLAGLIVSREMNADELAIREMATAAQVNVAKLFRGYDAEMQAAFEATANQHGLPLYVDSATMTLDGIVARISSMKLRHNIAWAAVDHIGLIRTPRFNSRNDQIGEITATLKALALRLRIPILALSQMNRQAEKDGRRPQLMDLRDSGNTEQDADMVVFLHRDSNDQTLKRVPIAIGVLKQRHGRSPFWLDSKIEFDGETQTFHEVDSRHAPPHWQERGVEM